VVICGACSQHRIETLRVCNKCFDEHWSVPSGPPPAVETNDSELVLVTGGTGLVGSAVIMKLLDGGRKVRALVRNPQKIPQEISKAEIVKGDVTDLNSIRSAMRGVGVVYHCAGLPEQWLDPTECDRFRKINFEGTVNMVTAAQEEKVRKFVYTSTMDVFEFEAEQPYDESKISKKTKDTPYQVSKQQADLYVTKKIFAEGFPAVIIHPSAVYGPPVVTGTLNAFFIKLAKNELPLSISGGVSVVYNFDCAEAHIIAEQRASIGSRYLVTEKYRTIHEIASEVSKHVGSKVPTELPAFLVKGASFVSENYSNYVSKEEPMIPSGALSVITDGGRASSTKIQDELGWTPISFEKGIKKTMKFMKANNFTDVPTTGAQ